MIFASERTPLRCVIILAALLSFPFHAKADFDSTTPVIRFVNGSISKDGHVKIEWSHVETTEVEVQQSESKQFNDAKLIYRGDDRGTFVSGLKDGTYYYRVRAVDGDWSRPVILTVQHHSLRLAFVLFSLGAVVFTLTVFIVIRGAYHASTE